MPLSKKDLDRFGEVFDIPAFIAPWLDRFFEESEIRLVLLLAEKPLRTAEIGAKWAGDRRYTQLKGLSALLDRSYRRGIIKRYEDGRFQPADFHARFDIWAMFEGWQDIPAEICERLNAWEFEYYRQQHRDQIKTLQTGGRRDPSKTWPEYILLHEAEALVDRVEHIYLWPCNCRSMMGRCRKNVYTCIRFSNHLDLGWEISKYRAKEIIRAANKTGLMQNGEVSVAPDGSISGAVCNCCADCCFPHQLSEQANAVGLWPLSRYVARHLVRRCTACGLCVKRCPFQAFKLKKPRPVKNSGLNSHAKNKPSIIFDKSLCRGCGVCSTGCPENAIEMIRLAGVKSAWEDKISSIIHPRRHR